MLIWLKNQRKVRYRTFQIRSADPRVEGVFLPIAPHGGSPAFLNAKGVLEGGQLYLYRAPTGHWVMGTPIGATLRTPVHNIEYFPPNFEKLVLGCIDADFSK